MAGQTGPTRRSAGRQARTKARADAAATLNSEEDPLTWAQRTWPELGLSGRGQQGQTIRDMHAAYQRLKVAAARRERRAA